MRILASAICLAGLASCTAVTEDAVILRGDALAERLSGQELRLRPPEGTADPNFVLIARLRPDGRSDMSAELDGQPVDAFEDTETWRVEGQTLCIFDGNAPDGDDCIRVDWISGDRIQLTQARADGSNLVTVGTLSAM